MNSDVNDDQQSTRERKSDAIRRLQVGGTGLALVALLVGLSTLLTSESRQDSPASGAAVAVGAQGDGGTATADAPMTDLGVEPAAADTSQAPAPTPKMESPPPDVPIVPDLQPDPQLKGASQRR